ncbi:MAG: matrixin family metalloprotease [Myxococcales bacterium]|nr:matrixin family metalloprotease [Myxococcales bacterium]MCB9577376.1 matrixin family metalloprotease [Polyangiaceae bacterium]
MRAEIALAAGLFVFGLSSAASAYCRTTTCTSKTCSTSPSCDQCLDGGLPLYWPSSCVSFSTQVDGSPLRGIDFETLRNAVATGFVQWQSAPCAVGGTPSINLNDFGAVTCDRQEYNQDAPNANIWMFRDDYWPYVGSNSTLALTTITFNVKTGQIFDADVEINSAENAITVGDVSTQYDLLSIATHEAGHFLGLSHSCDQSATMFSYYATGDTSMRSLEADDIAGICSIYPPGDTSRACDATPRHGFSTKCKTPEDKGCCTTAPGRPSGSGSLAVFAGLLGLALLTARRRRS